MKPLAYTQHPYPMPEEIAEAKARHARECARKLADAMNLPVSYDGVPADCGGIYAEAECPVSEAEHALSVTADRMLADVLAAPDDEHRRAIAKERADRACRAELLRAAEKVVSAIESIDFSHYASVAVAIEDATARLKLAAEHGAEAGRVWDGGAA